LELIEENTAAALYFGSDRVLDTPYTVLFYNMGASSIQVSIVTYSSKEGSIFYLSDYLIIFVIIKIMYL